MRAAKFSLSPLAARYLEFLSASFPDREQLSEDFISKLSGELEWQSRWFAGDFGRHFTTTDGTPVEIVQLGWWNHGAGPDFRDCAILVDGQTLRGSIELDPLDKDWEHHGHAENPAYEDVVLHLFLERTSGEFFTRTSSHRQIPQVILSAHPLVEPAGLLQPSAKAGRCSLQLAQWPANRIASLFEAAARYRLEKKAARWKRVEQIHGRDQALFQGIAEVLGYSKNKLPMTILAQRYSLKFLLKHPAEREALLFGAAGWMDSVSFDEADTTTRSYLRTLWETWWKYRALPLSNTASLPLPWNLSAIRPMNHPQRRLAALSEVAAHWSTICCWTNDPENFVEKDFRASLEKIHHPYWDHHFTLTSKPTSKPMALLGATRTADLLANLIYPMLVPEREALWFSYCQKPAPLDNEKSSRAALRLFGSNVSLADNFTCKLHHHQALLQIYEDFCCVDATDCIHCPFPEQLTQWS